MDLLGNILMGLVAIGSLLLLLPLVWLTSGKGGGLVRTVAEGFDRVNSFLAGVGIWAVLSMALVQAAIVVMRYVFGVNFIWLQESVVYLFGITFLLLAGYVLLCDEHVRVDLFYREAGPRQKAWTDFLGTYLLLFPVCGLILWAAGPYVARSWAVFEPSSEPSGIPAVFLLKSLIPIFALLLSMAGFSVSTRAAMVLRGEAEAKN